MALNRRPAAALGIIYVVWGANFAAVDVAVDDLAPAAMMGARFLLAGLLLLALSQLANRPWSIDRRSRWRSAAATAVPLFAGGSGLLAWGQTRLSSGMAAVLISTMPVWLIVIAMAHNELPARPSTLVAPGVGIVGVIIIANPNVADPVDPAGCALVLAAALSWAIGSRRSRASSANNVIEQTAMQMTVGGGILCAIALGIAATGRPIGTPTPEAVGATIWLIAISSMLGFSAYTYALQHAPLAAVAVYPYANIAIAVALGAFLLNEPITITRTIGSAIVVSATLIAHLTTAKRASSRSAHRHDQRTRCCRLLAPVRHRG